MAKFEINEVLYLRRYKKDSLTRDDNSSTFFHHAQFIHAVRYAADSIKAVLGDITEQIVVDTINYYNTYQVSKAMGLIDDDIKNSVRYLVNLPLFSTYIKDPIKFAKAQGIIKGCMTQEGINFIFQQTFYDWLKEFTDESSNN